MMIERNPFYILECSTKDTKQTILDKAEEKALFEDPDVIEQAKEVLLDSGKRLDAELGWFVAPWREEEQLLMDILRGKNKVSRPVPEFDEDYDQATFLMEAIARRNYAHRPNDFFGRNMIAALRLLEEYFDEESLEFSRLLQRINENRNKARMSYINEDDLSDHLHRRQENIIEAIKGKMNDLEVDQLLASVHLIADEMTKHGEERASELVESLLSMYEIETRQFADKQAERIHRSISFAEQAKEAPEENQHSILSQAINEIVVGMKNWQRVMEPLQILAMSQGREHDSSASLLRDVRRAAISMNNECEEPQFARQLTESLRYLHVAKYLPEFEAAFEKDRETLDNLIEEGLQEKQKADENHKTWARRIYYKTELGTIFKDTFELSEDGINYNARLIPLDDVIGLSWGAISKSINYIPTGTDYRISYYYGNSSETLKLSNKQQYMGIIEHLWDAVAMRIMFRMIRQARDGEKLCVGRILFDNDGVFLDKKSFFHSDTKLFSWKEPLRVVLTVDGGFYIDAEDGKYESQSVSYMNDMNSQIFETLLQAIQKNHFSKLSDFLK